MRISKKFIAWAAALAMLMSVALSLGFLAFADGFDGAASGSGKDGDPYLISNLEQLGKLRDYVNSGNDCGGMYFELTADIDLGGETAPWTPIGDYSDPFGGTFDGGGHLISGLYIDSSDSYIGLFGDSGGTVQNLGVSGEIVGGGSYVGGVAGYNSYGTIENCYNLCSVSGSVNVGGITGDNYSGEITNCYNAGVISAMSNVGGIAGFNRGTIEKCYSSGAVSAASPQITSCGAIAGRATGGEISGCYYLMNTASGGIAGSDQAGGTTVLSANDLAQSGSFSGWDFDGTWEINSFLKRPTLKSVPQPLSVSSKAELESLASYVNSGSGGADILLTADIDLGCSAEKPWTPIGTSAAPFSGTFDGGGHTISGLYTDQNSGYQGLFGYAAQGSVIQNIGITGGNVSGSGNNAGSVAGYSAGEISRCYSAASSTGGGIVGNNAGEVSNCYNIGAAAVGGIVAANSGTVSNCYNTAKSGSGIAGSSSGAVTGCYYLSGSASGGIAGSDPQDGAKAVSSDELAKKDTFSGWDFDAVWEIGAFARPILKSVPEHVFTSGSGSEEDPYIIDSASVLSALAGYVNSGNGKNEFFKLNNDIDLGGADNNFTPIGNATAKFGGTFYGGGHKISGLNINSSGDDQGLFGYVDSGAAVKDLTVEGSVKGKDNVGGIAGQNAGTIENCHNACDITGTNNVGGIAGQTVKNGDLVGGVLRYNYNSGAVSGQDSVGGVVGLNQYTTQDSYNIDNVSGKNNVGGAAGKNSGTVWRVYNIGKVSGSGSNVGGAIGDPGTIVNYNYYLASCGAEGSGNKLTIEKFAQKDTFQYWDFDKVWTIDFGVAARPVLKSNPEPSLFASGSGTADDPFEIPDLETLERFRDYTNNNDLPALYYELTNDIDMSKEYGDGKKSWTPIGKNADTKFNGTFLGNNHKISGLYINTGDDEQGLFGIINGGASVKDLTVEGSVKGGVYVGGISGESDGTISGCTNSATISGSSYIGGIAGNNDGAITNCANSAAVSPTSTSAKQIGGITGESFGTISGCRNNGSVSGGDCGGIVGYNYGKLENCENYGSVSAAGSDPNGFGSDCVIGGIASVNENQPGNNTTGISGCANYGTVSSGGHSGGIVGNNDNSLENCENYGSVSGDIAVGGIAGVTSNNENVDNDIGHCSNFGAIGTGQYGGGIAGKIEGTITEVEGGIERAEGTIAYCHNDGSITIRFGASVFSGSGLGGITGYNLGVLEQCYNTGDVSSSALFDTAVGGIAGYGTEYATVNYCYNIGNINGGKYNAGIEGTYDIADHTATHGHILAGEIKNCYNFGSIAGDSMANRRYSTEESSYDVFTNIFDCYTLNGVSESSEYGTGISAEEFKTLAGALGSSYKDDAFLGRPILKDNPENNGDGTQDAPHLISSLSTLETFRDYVNSGNGSGEYFKLAADIDMSGKYGEDKESWTPIGNDKAFSGTFDGDGHTISGLFINSKDDNQGLFGYVGDSGTVKNFGVSGTVTGGSSTGGIAGKLGKGTIENCKNGCAVSGSSDVGGIAGQSNGTVKNCCNTGEIKGKDKVGSVCSNTGNGKVTNCYYLENTGDDSNATVKTADEFKSGEVAYLLQSGCDSPTWGQNGDFPDLIAFNKNIKTIHKVTFESERPKVADVYIPDGERLSVKDDYPYVKWSQTAPGAGEQPEFDLSTPITSDMTLYLIEGREFEQSSDGDITLKAEFGAPFEQDLLSLLKFADGSGITGSDFEFELKDGSTLPSSFTLEGGKLKSDKVTSDIGTYSVTFNITDKKPYSNIALTALDPSPAEFCAELTITLDVSFRGGGTADSPYEIPNLEALELFRDYINAGNGSGEYFKLTANINMSDKYGENIASWTPIGTYDKAFEGSFDGDGHTISGLYINSQYDNYQGLFGSVGENGAIKNLGLDGAVTGGNYTGGIVGYVEHGTIENCRNGCDVRSYDYHVGGIAGESYYGTIQNCHNSGAVTNRGNYTGGIAGSLEHGTIENCRNGCDVSGYYDVGGIAGINSDGTVQNCHNSGAVTERLHGGAGGIVGESNSTVQNCYNIGNINGSREVGGICGTYSDGSITNCYYLDGTHEDPNAKVMTADEFKSGKAAWLLQSGCDEPTWGQKIGEDDYPILTSDADKKVVKVTFATNDNAAYAASYTNAGGKVTLPEDPDIDGTEFKMWSTSSAAPFEEFNADTAVTEDMVVHSVRRELFGGESDAVSLSGTYGEGITADLSQYIEYKNGASVSGGFRYTISDEGQTEASINGSMLAIPKNTNAGSYTLKVTVEEKTPLFSLASVETFGTDPVTLTINVNIAKADPVVVVKSANTLYDDDPEPDDLVIGTTSGGTLQYSTDGETYTEDIPKAHEAGEYTVWYKVVGDNNYNDVAPKSIKAKIAHGFADVATKPRAVRGLVFSGEPQELITAGSGTNGEMQYSLDGENYSPEIPTGTAAGQYTVWYKVVGGFIDGKHYHDSEAASLTATIGKGDSAVGSDGADVVYGDAFTLTAEVSKSDAGASLASDEDKVDFYIGDEFLGSADADYGSAALKDSGTASLTVTADKKFAIGANVIRAEYGGSVNLNNSENDSITVTMTQKPIEYEVSARNKTYDGTADVEVTLTPTNSGNDDVALTAKGAAPSANAGGYETVDLTGIAISGADAGYYSVDSEKSGVKLEKFAAISKAKSNVKTPPTANDLTYSGEAQELVTAGEADGGTLVYASEQNGDYTENIPTGTNAGDYTVWYKVIGDSNHNDSKLQSIAASINKAVSSGTVTANELTYTGEAQELVTAGDTDGGTLVYASEQNGEYSENIPTGTDAGDYTVWYKVIGDSNHSDSEPKSITVNIAKADPIVTVKSAKALYDDEIHELVTYEAPSGVTVLFSDSENGEYSAAIPTGTAAGEYTVWYKAVGNNNYNDLPPASVKVKIAHGFADVTKVPTAVENLVYSGSPQQLITPGEAENGEMRYSLDGKNYSADIPTATEAGEYTVWYMAAGGFIDGKQYHDSDPTSITVTIAMQGEFDYIIKSAAIGGDGKLSVEIEYQEEEPKAAKLIVASYDAEGALTETKAFDINGADVDLGGYAPRGDKIKIFIWSGLDDMTPLAMPYEIK